MSRVTAVYRDVFFGEGFQPEGGHLKIISDYPVVTFALFGSQDLVYLSAVETQRARF